MGNLQGWSLATCSLLHLFPCIETLTTTLLVSPWHNRFNCPVTTGLVAFMVSRKYWRGRKGVMYEQRDYLVVKKELLESSLSHSPLVCFHSHIFFKKNSFIPKFIHENICDAVESHVFFLIIVFNIFSIFDNDGNDYLIHLSGRDTAASLEVTQTRNISNY